MDDFIRRMFQLLTKKVPGKYRRKIGGDSGTRTCDLMLVTHAL